MTDNTIVFHEPVRPGDRLRTRQILRSVSDVKTTKLGTGRFWVIDVEYENQRGDLVGRGELHRVRLPPGRRGGGRVTHPDAAPRATCRPGDALPELRLRRHRHHRRPRGAGQPATGAPCTTTRTSPSSATAPRTSSSTRPNQAAWFERYITDWTGPYGRLRRVTFRMRGSVFPGDTMVLRGTVTDTGDRRHRVRVGRAVDIAVSVDGDVKTTCTARVALPLDADDNPWARSGDRWTP